MIRIYPSALDGEPMEVHAIDRAWTVQAWLAHMVGPEFDRDTASRNISVAVDGVTVTPENWATTCIGPDNEVRVVAQPHGEVVAIVTVALIASAVTMALMAMTPKPPNARGQRQGEQMGDGRITANHVRFGDPVPEIAGSPKVYPIYLVPPRRYYVDRRQQWIDAFFCIGAGRYEKSVAEVRVGNTPVPALGDSADVEFYEPGQDLTGVEAAEWWHSPQEVGFTSFGTAGMKLGAATSLTRSWLAGSFLFSGMTISAPAGEQPVPTNWTAGAVLRVLAPYPVTFTPGTPRDRISGNGVFQTYRPNVGDRIEIDGENDGIYIVASYDPGQAGQAGSPARLLAEDDVVRLDFGVTPALLSITAEGGPFSVSLSVDVADVDELVAVINSQLNSTPVRAEADGDRVNLVEQAPYLGLPIGVTGSGVADVFGGSPTLQPGTPTIPDSGASITLNDEAGNPVSGLTHGEFAVALGYEGLRYSIIDIPGTHIVEVRQLDATGGLVAGWTGFASLSTVNATVELDPTSLEGGWVGPFVGNPEGRLVDAFEVNFLFPGGLVYTKSSGSQRVHGIEVLVEWRRANTADPWTRTVYYYEDATRDQIGFTERITLPEPMPVEVRVRRADAPSTSTQTVNDVQWVGFCARVVGGPTQYEGMTTMKARLHTGNRLSGEVENKIWLRPTRILPSVDGGPDEPTRDIAPFLLHVLRSAGYPDSALDLAKIEELHPIWSARRDTFDLVYDTPSTIKRVANETLRPGFSQLTIADSLLTPVRDVLDSQPEIVLSAQEFTQPLSVTSALPAPDEIDGVDAEYEDRETGTVRTVEFRLPGDAGTRAERIRLPGVTRYEKAFELAARHRRERAFRRVTFSGRTEQHLRAIPYLAVVGIQEQIPGYSQSAFVLRIERPEVGRLLLTLSEPLSWPDDPVIAIRSLNGDPVGPLDATPGPDGVYQVVIDEPDGVMLRAGAGAVQATVVYFGQRDQVFHVARISRIQPQDNGQFQFEAVINDPRVYEDDLPDPEPIDWIENMGELLVWLDAARGETLIQIDNRVATWVGRSRSEISAVQPSAALRPVVSADVFSPQAVRFREVGASDGPDVPTEIGEYFGGGYYIGDIEIEGVLYAIIMGGPETQVTAQWKTSNTATVGTVSSNNGIINTNSMMNWPSEHPAAAACVSADLGGFGDSYMPAREELDLAWQNRTNLIELGMSTANFYWSSTAVSTTGAWRQVFTTGASQAQNKTSSYFVRPVRRIRKS